MIRLFLFLCVLNSAALFAQNAFIPPFYKSYDWEANPKLHEVPDSAAKSNAYIVKDKTILEYALDENGFFLYKTKHQIIKLNSDKAIERNNKIYIPMSYAIDAYNIKARTISKAGKVTELDSKNIKNVENYEDLGPFKIFAVEGAELGGEIEFLYTTKNIALPYGTEYVQSEESKKQVDIDIYFPKHIKIEAKSYNGFVPFTADTTVQDKKKIFASAVNIPGVDDEQYSVGKGALMRVEYKFAYGGQNPSKRLYTWANRAEDYYKRITDVSSGDKSKAKSFLGKIGIDKNESEEEKIRKIETYVKTNLSIKENADDDKMREVSFLLKNKYGSELAILRLYNLLFDEAGISHEFAMTSNRFRKKFDKDFDSWTYTDHDLIYFPGINKLMAPTETFTRLGFIPYGWSCQSGLFVEPVVIGEYASGIGKIKEIPCTACSESMSTMEATMKFDLDLGETNVHLKQSTTGYEASYDQPFYSRMDEDDKKKYLEQRMKVFSEDVKPKNIKVTGTEDQDILRNPFVVEADMTTNSLLEKTGDKYLFKIGLVIGPQGELYKENERKTPIENRFNHGYLRILSFEIPDGYKVTNLNALNMEVIPEGKDKATMLFTSSYKLEGNKVIVTVKEEYHQIAYSLDLYEQFRKVINAAADFNKIVIYLEKK